MLSLFDFSPFCFSSGSTILIGVSGGGDSMALLVIFQSFARKMGLRVVAATVDHQLRSESFREAQFVADSCRCLDVDHYILPWSGEKPRTGLLQAARKARYRLLANLAEQEGAVVVMTAHTRDDQAETVLMRQARSMGYGISGIPPATLFDNRIWFCRPFLSLYRDDLRKFLQRKKRSWIEDPSNKDLLRERNRVRADLSCAPDGLSQINAALKLSEYFTQRRIEVGAGATEIIMNHAALVSPGLIRLSSPALLGDRECVLHALRILIAVSGGAMYLPDIRRCRVLLDRLLQGPIRTTLSRSLIDSRKTGIFFLREARGLPPMPCVSSFASFTWDRRYRIVSRGKPRSYVFSQLADDVPDSLKSIAKKTWPSTAESNMSIIPIVSLWSDFLPSFDRIPAQAVAQLIGALPFSFLPCGIDQLSKKVSWQEGSP